MYDSSSSCNLSVPDLCLYTLRASLVVLVNEKVGPARVLFPELALRGGCLGTVPSPLTAFVGSHYYALT
jgi:hypothetical protein